MKEGDGNEKVKEKEDNENGNEREGGRARRTGRWRSSGIVVSAGSAATGQKRSSSRLAVYWFAEELKVSKRDWNEGGKRNRTHLDRQCYAQNSRASPHRPRTWQCR